MDRKTQKVKTMTKNKKNRKNEYYEKLKKLIGKDTLHLCGGGVNERRFHIEINNKEVGIIDGVDIILYNCDSSANDEELIKIFIDLIKNNKIKFHFDDYEK